MKTKNRIEDFEEESPLKIRNQSFSDELSLDQYVEWNALARILFLDCRFEELDLLGKVFGSCDFKNCKFNNLSFRKCQFSNCRFENCQIVGSDLTRAEFNDCIFRNCELTETKFENSGLDPILLIY